MPSGGWKMGLAVSVVLVLLGIAIGWGLIFKPSADPSAGDLTITMYVSSDFGSGYIETAGDGSVKQISRPS